MMIYIFRKELHKNIAAYKSSFSSSCHRIGFSMKANYSPVILSMIKTEGLDVVTVSGNEVLLALKLGFKAWVSILFFVTKMTYDFYWKSIVSHGSREVRSSTTVWASSAGRWRWRWTTPASSMLTACLMRSSSVKSP